MTLLYKFKGVKHFLTVERAVQSPVGSAPTQRFELWLINRHQHTLRLGSPLRPLVPVQNLSNFISGL